MKNSYVSSLPFHDFALWKKIERKRALTHFDLEITARCNNDCGHCYINLPAEDREAMTNELSLEEIREISDEALSMGALWCLISGGEPLLRKDFPGIYFHLRKKGFLISLFTNATLITKEHIEIFKKHPPRDIEVTVYGATKETYERVTRVPGSFDAFKRGLTLLFDNNIRVRLKAMVMKSNVHEMAAITKFCREKTKDFFRFDASLLFRYDRDPERNRKIRKERLTAREITALDRDDFQRFHALNKECGAMLAPETRRLFSNRIFQCGAGRDSFCVSYDGRFRLCSSLCHPDCEYDLKKGTLSYAWLNFAPRIRELRTDRKDFLETCGVCPLFDLCSWCPAHAALETGELDAPVKYFCDMARERVNAITGE